MTPNDALILLGVSPNFSQEELKQAYRARIRLFHPDRFPSGSADWKNASKMLEDLNEANDILIHEQQRQEQELKQEQERQRRQQQEQRQREAQERLRQQEEQERQRLRQQAQQQREEQERRNQQEETKRRQQVEKLFEEGINFYYAKKYSSALASLTMAAQAGDIVSQHALGQMYSQIIEVKDDRQAVYWHNKAAEAGHAGSQYILGMMYAQGRGIQQDYNQALHWLLKADKQGHAEARTEVPKVAFEALMAFKRQQPQEERARQEERERQLKENAKIKIINEYNPKQASSGILQIISNIIKFYIYLWLFGAILVSIFWLLGIR